MLYDCSLIVVPQREEDVAEYDWDSFPPAKTGSKSFTIIDESAGIDGKLIARNAFIHGQIHGLVFAESVTVDKTGRVSGVIFCRSLTVLGNVQANIVCDSIVVRAGGLLSAILKYKSLRVEPGGIVGGKFEKRVVIDARPKEVGAQPRKSFLSE